MYCINNLIFLSFHPCFTFGLKRKCYHQVMLWCNFIHPLLELFFIRNTLCLLVSEFSMQLLSCLKGKRKKSCSCCHVLFTSKISKLLYAFPSKTSPLRSGASVGHIPNINKLYYTLYHYYEIRLQVRENTFGPWYTRAWLHPSTKARVEKPGGPVG